MSQSKYITDLLIKFGFSNIKPTEIPISKKSTICSSLGTPMPDPQVYRSVVGSLQYLAITRLDISFVVNKVCQFMAKSCDTHWVKVKMIFIYLSWTLNHGISMRLYHKLDIKPSQIMTEHGINLIVEVKEVFLSSYVPI